MGDGRFCFTEHALRRPAERFNRPLKSLPKTIEQYVPPIQLEPPVVSGEPLFAVPPLEEFEFPPDDEQG